MLVSGVEEFGLLLFGVEFEDGLAVLFGFDEFMSVLLDGEVVLVVELELELGAVVFMSVLLDGAVEFVVALELELGAVEFMSVLLVDDEEDGEAVEFVSVLDVLEDGEVEVLEPVWLDWVDGVL